MSVDERLLELLTLWEERNRQGSSTSAREICTDFPELTGALEEQIAAYQASAWMEIGTHSQSGSDLTRTMVAGKAADSAVSGNSDLPRLSLEQYLARVAESGLYEYSELTSLLADVPSIDRPATALAMSEFLRERGYLSTFQMEALAEGRCKKLVLGEYELIEYLGGGGMGQVYKARQRVMDTFAALKVLRDATLATPDAIRRFHTEVRATAHLDHPNIVRALYASNVEGLHYLVMEFADGMDLAAMVRNRGPLPVDEVLDYVSQAADALDYVHSYQVIHRDIKPSNLLVTRDNQIKVLDLGLARMRVYEDAETPQLTQSNMAVGSAPFMSPEQARDSKNADHRTDIYGLGCTMYYLLTGKEPYTGRTPIEIVLAHTERPIPSMLDVAPGLPARLQEIFERMVAKKVEDRYSAMSEVVEAIQELKQEYSCPNRDELAGPTAAVTENANQSGSFTGLEGQVSTSSFETPTGDLQDSSWKRWMGYLANHPRIRLAARAAVILISAYLIYSVTLANRNQNGENQASLLQSNHGTNNTTPPRRTEFGELIRETETAFAKTAPEQVIDRLQGALEKLGTRLDASPNGLSAEELADLAGVHALRGRALLAMSLNVSRSNTKMITSLGQYDPREERLNLLDQAMTEFAAAAELNRDRYGKQEPYLQAELERGLVHLELQDFPAAIKDFSEVLQRDPASRWVSDANYVRGYAHLQFARSKFRIGEAAEGLASLNRGKEDLTKALARQPGNSVYLRTMGKLSWELASRADNRNARQDFELAVNSFTQVTNSDEKSADDFNFIGLLHRSRGKLADAISFLDESVKMNSDAGYLLRGLCHAELAKQDRSHLQPAIMDLNRGLQAYPKSNEVLKDLPLWRCLMLRGACTLLAAGPDASLTARRDFTQALKAYPLDAWSTASLRRLKELYAARAETFDASDANPVREHDAKIVQAIDLVVSEANEKDHYWALARLMSDTNDSANYPVEHASEILKRAVSLGGSSSLNAAVESPDVGALPFEVKSMRGNSAPVPDESDTE